MAQYISFHVRLWTEPQDQSQRWQMRHVQSGREVAIVDDAFMLTLWVEPDNTKTLRGMLKHVESGESVPFQAGERMLEFIMGHLKLPVSLMTGSSQPGGFENTTGLGEQGAEPQGQNKHDG